MRNWLLGTEVYAYPWLRWLAMPLFRIGVPILGIPIAVTGHATWVSWLGVGLMLVSLAVELVSILITRTRRRHTDVGVS